MVLAQEMGLTVEQRHVPVEELSTFEEAEHAEPQL
jgi:hypothetical protein